MWFSGLLVGGASKTEVLAGPYKLNADVLEEFFTKESMEEMEGVFSCSLHLRHRFVNVALVLPVVGCL